MKTGFRSTVALILCFLMVITVFTACSFKKANNDNTSTTVIPDDNWQQGDGYYQPVTVDGVELAEIVQKAIGDEASGFNGDLNSLSKDQISKVRQVAAVEGYVVKTDDDGKTVIQKDNLGVTEAASEVYSEVMSQAELENQTNLTPSEYEKVSRIAEDRGVTAVTNEKGNVTILQKETTTAAPAPQQTNGATTEAVSDKGFFDNLFDKDKKTTENKQTNAPNQTEKPISTVAPSYVPSSRKPTETYTLAVNTTAVTKSVGNTVGNNSNSIFVKNAMTSDGGTVAVGTTMTDEEGKTLDYSSGLIAKFNSDGKKAWSHILTANDLISFDNVTSLSDGSIIVVGTTLASNLVPDEDYKCKGSVEGIIVKYSASGERSWIKTFGGSEGDLIYAVYPSADGGILIGGKSTSSDFNLKNVGSNPTKAYVAKLDSNANPIWVSALTGNKHCAVYDIAQASDGTIYAITDTVCADGDFAKLDKTLTRRHAVISRLSPSGSYRWSKVIWESGTVNFQNIAVAPDGGVVAAGQYSASSNGNEGIFKGMYNGGQPGTFDGGVVKFTPDGSKEWVVPLVGFQNDFVTGITPVNGGFAVSGFTTSTNRNFSFENKGEFDSFVYIVTKDGALQASSPLAGTLSDRAMDICGNGKTVYLCGSTGSSDLDFASVDFHGTADKTAAFIYKFTLTQV